MCGDLFGSSKRGGGTAWSSHINPLEELILSSKGGEDDTCHRGEGRLPSAKTEVTSPVSLILYLTV